jgi:hypothetical protein
MRRSLCWMGIVVLGLWGCAKKSAPPETTTVKASQPLAAPVKNDMPTPPPAESNAPAPPAQTEHPVVTATREFLNCVATRQYTQALALTSPGEITRLTLNRMYASFLWEQATFAQLWVGAEQAVVITNPVPTRQGSASFIWAFNLIATEDGHWLVRLADPLDSPQDAEDYIAALRAVTPDAKSIEL